MNLLRVALIFILCFGFSTTLKAQSTASSQMFCKLSAGLSSNQQLDHLLKEYQKAIELEVDDDDLIFDLIVSDCNQSISDVIIALRSENQDDYELALKKINKFTKDFYTLNMHGMKINRMTVAFFQLQEKLQMDWEETFWKGDSLGYVVLGKKGIIHKKQQDKKLSEKESQLYLGLILGATLTQANPSFVPAYMKQFRILLPVLGVKIADMLETADGKKFPVPPAHYFDFAPDQSDVYDQVQSRLLELESTSAAIGFSSSAAFEGIVNLLRGAGSKSISVATLSGIAVMIGTESVIKKHLHNKQEEELRENLKMRIAQFESTSNSQIHEKLEATSHLIEAVQSLKFFYGAELDRLFKNYLQGLEAAKAENQKEILMKNFSTSLIDLKLNWESSSLSDLTAAETRSYLLQYFQTNQQPQNLKEAWTLVNELFPKEIDPQYNSYARTLVTQFAKKKKSFSDTEDGFRAYVSALSSAANVLLADDFKNGYLHENPFALLHQASLYLDREIKNNNLGLISGFQRRIDKEIRNYQRLMEFAYGTFKN